MEEKKSPEQLSLEKDDAEYVKKVTPTHNLWMQMLRAFLVGGIICVIGQFLLNFAKNTLAMDKEMSKKLFYLQLIHFL